MTIQEFEQKVKELYNQLDDRENVSALVYALNTKTLEVLMTGTDCKKCMILQMNAIAEMYDFKHEGEENDTDDEAVH